MPEPILTLKRPGFPKESIRSDGRETLIEYIGEEADLRTAGVVTGQTWGDYSGRVEDADLDPIDGTTKAILTVRLLYKWGSAEYGETIGEEQQTIHEIEWVDVQRPLQEHPVFSSNGAFSLTDTDLIKIRRWQDMTDATLKAQWKFYTDDDNSATEELSDNAQVFAKGILKGIEYYVDKAPLLRKSTFYKNGPPPQDGGGTVESPGSFPGVSGLSGYEWIRSADRSGQTGTEKDWRRDQEWLGARKVWIDKDNIYWT
jgi:hypothetical protein